ncbi:MAG: ATP-binding protein [Pyrinomonadaceae bacterium]
MFKKLVGNENVKLTLRRLREKNRVPNSFLFAGSEGVGKRQFALELAKGFVCVNPADGEACGVCSACLRVDKLQLPKSDDKDTHKRIVFTDHADVGVVMAYNRNILVDAVRHLESEANFRPFEAAARFFIIDDAEKMNDAASNALLKTLEEPPATTYIFLITAQPDALLPTIRSRCQTLRFASISDEDIERYLMDERAFSPDEAKLAARLAQGSIGRAVSIDVKQFRERRARMMNILVNAIEDHNLAALLRTSEEINDAKNKTSFEEHMDILQSLIHDVWSLRVTGDAGMVVNTDLTDRLTSLAQNPGSVALPAWIAAIDEMRLNLIVNINRRVATDALFAGMGG